MSAEVHVSSVLVHSRPGCGEEVAAALARRQGLEVHAATPEGKIVVVLETGTVAEVLDEIESIRAQPGVVGAALVFHGIDEPSPEETWSSPCP